MILVLGGMLAIYLIHWSAAGSGIARANMLAATRAPEAARRVRFAAKVTILQPCLARCPLVSVRLRAMPIAGLDLGVRVLSVIVFLFSHAASAAPWSASVDQKGLPIVSRGGASALTSDFAFWGSSWAWADMPETFKVLAPYKYAFEGNNRTLNFGLAGTARKSSDQQLVWEFDLDARRKFESVIGGGIVFRFDLDGFGGEMGEPALLPGNRGWTWGRAGSARMEMRFDPPLASVHFASAGQKGEIRAFFYDGEIVPEEKRYTATLNLTGDVLIGPSMTEKFGLDDPTTWPTDILDWQSSPVDLSFLNAGEKPAGKHGFLHAMQDKMVFQDGSVARFWGTNLAAYALFGTSRDNVRQQAHRLSELGFNLVRLHHHDSDWVDPNIFGGTRAPDTQHLSPDMLEKLDWWIKCLKDEGIYVWLDLEVGRRFKAGDGIYGFDEISKGSPTAQLWGYNYVNLSMQQAMQRFNEAYVNHVNVYTKTRYGDEPAIIAMLITNENDLTHHFGNALLGDKGVPKHNALYMRQAEAFAAGHGLPKDKIWRAWEDGPAKIFLNDLEQSFDVEMIRHLRSLGVRAPIVTTSTWGFNPLSSLPALTLGDFIDAHAYAGIDELSKNPAYAPTLTEWIAAAHVAGKPLSVTEWNSGDTLAPDRHCIPLFVAAAASHQGWPALMQYAYSQVPLNSAGTPSIWHAFNDPAQLATMPAAALMYRRGDVRPATTTYAFAPGGEHIFSQAISPLHAVALRTAAETGRLVVVLPSVAALPWLKAPAVPAGAIVVTDPAHSLIADNAAEAVSDTGELKRNWEQGSYTINTPRTQAATGWVGGKSIHLADTDIAVTTLNATVAVQSLDANPINRSRAILISLGARSVAKSGTQLPYYSEPVEGQVTIHAPKRLHLYKSGNDSQEIAAPYRDGRYFVRLDRSLGTYWLTLK
jgi:hypothetical protein